MSNDHALDPTVLNAVQDTLRRELRLGPEPIDPQDRLDLLPEADSVRLMRAISVLEREFDTELDDMAISDAQTVGDLVALLQDSLPASTTPRH
ncbi:MAG TPA: acyl carrier protein [Pseudonocardiaceae bacterium]|jgi:acyl carrier protein|nr:acyl carrier protein [Pseudonocardiaceae bacterium]